MGELEFVKRAFDYKATCPLGLSPQGMLANKRLNVHLGQ